MAAPVFQLPSALVSNLEGKKRYSFIFKKDFGVTRLMRKTTPKHLKKKLNFSYGFVIFSTPLSTCF
jgi:hypothetical protein